MVADERSGGDQDARPDYWAEHRKVIHEDNWPDYQARGFVPIPPSLEECDDDLVFLLYGLNGVYSGDGWDVEAGRPSKDKPESFYTNPDGLEYYEAAKSDLRKHLYSPFGFREPPRRL
jgi:hypothetical protein